MKTIITISRTDYWQAASTSGQYSQSTLTSTLEEIGYIHCTSPSQTMDIVQRFSDVDDVMLLLIDENKVKNPVRYEPAPSGRPGLFPHIYGSLYTDAVYETIALEKNDSGEFIAPERL